MPYNPMSQQNLLAQVIRFGLNRHFSQERQSRKRYKAMRKAIIALGHGDNLGVVMLFLYLQCAGEYRDAF